MTDDVERKLDQLDDLDEADDPTVLLQDGADGTPVVAKADGELRMLSTRVVYARRVDVEDVSAAWDRHGELRLVDLSTQSFRSDADDFREVAELER